MQRREEGVFLSPLVRGSRLSAVPCGAQWQSSRQGSRSLLYLQDILFKLDLGSKDGRSERLRTSNRIHDIPEHDPLHILFNMSKIFLNRSMEDML